MGGRAVVKALGDIDKASEHFDLNVMHSMTRRDIQRDEEFMRNLISKKNSKD